MPLGMPAVANSQNPLGDRSEIAVSCHYRYLPWQNRFRQHSDRSSRRERGTRDAARFASLWSPQLKSARILKVNKLRLWEGGCPIESEKIHGCFEERCWQSRGRQK